MAKRVEKWRDEIFAFRAEETFIAIWNRADKPRERNRVAIVCQTTGVLLRADAA